MCYLLTAIAILSLLSFSFFFYTCLFFISFFFFFLNDPPPTEIYPLPLHDALPIYFHLRRPPAGNSTLAAEFKVDPLPVENPLLRRDLLNRIRRFEYSGRHRNIFPGEVQQIPP